MWLYIWITALFIHLAYWIFLFRKAGSERQLYKGPSPSLPPVSVVICFKNEVSTISETIAMIRNQTYPEFEIIAVDDFSTDGSYEALQQLACPGLKIIKASKDIPGKKQALTDGIRAADFDVILVTDADCVPASSNWISRMAETLTMDNATIVAGFSPMKKKDSFISRFAAFETMMTAMQYISYTFAGIPYMAPGRNMMYRKSVFDKYADKLYHNIMAGDDDLLIRNAYGHEKVSICSDKDAWMYTDPKSDISSFLIQKLRHISVSNHYRPIHQFLLGLYASSMLIVYMVAIVLFFIVPLNYGLICFVLLSKWIIQSLLHWSFFKKTDGLQYAMTYPFWEFCLVVYYCLMAILSLFYRSSSWK